MYSTHVRARSFASQEHLEIRISVGRKREVSSGNGQPLQIGIVPAKSVPLYSSLSEGHSHRHRASRVMEACKKGQQDHHHHEETTPCFALKPSKRTNVHNGGRVILIVTQTSLHFIIFFFFFFPRLNSSRSSCSRRKFSRFLH